MSSAGGVTTEPGVAGFLEADHAGIDALLSASVVGDTFDLSVYGAFRGRLLRHIGMEEKILLPFARAAQPDTPLAVAKQLKLDHGALVSLLVPRPTRRIVEQLRALLAAHNPLEEGEGGVYRISARLAGTGEGSFFAGFKPRRRCPNPPNTSGGGQAARRSSLWFSPPTSRRMEPGTAGGKRRVRPGTGEGPSSRRARLSSAHLPAPFLRDRRKPMATAVEDKRVDQLRFRHRTRAIRKAAQASDSF